MGYGLYRGHRYHFWSEGICKGFEPASLVVEVSEIIIHKADEPNPFVGLFDADGLAGEHLAEIDLLAIEAGASAGGDGGSSVMEGIFDVRQASIGPWRRAISLRGILHVECLVGPFVVIAIDEVIELGLLLQEVAGSRFGGLQLQG